MPPAYTEVKYGLLYNWYAATDARKITSSDTWVVPLLNELTPLVTYLGGTSVAGGKLKELGLTYFNSPNTGATNLVGFNGRGAGGRYNNWTDFLINQWCGLWTSSQYSSSTAYAYYLQYNSAACLLYTTGIVKKLAASVRLRAVSTLLTHGQTGTYTGNDGKIYRTICINGVEWIADNLAETKFRNGDYIHGYEWGVYTPITNTDWAALTTAGVCCYADNILNI